MIGATAITVTTATQGSARMYVCPVSKNELLDLGVVALVAIVATFLVTWLGVEFLTVINFPRR